MVPLLNLFNVPDAEMLAPATLIGIIEMFLLDLMVIEADLK